MDHNKPTLVPATLVLALSCQFAAAQQAEFADSLRYNGHPDSRTPTLIPLQLEPKDYYPPPRSGMGVWRWRQSATQYHRSLQAAYRLDAERSEYKISELRKIARREREADQAARIKATQERLARRRGVDSPQKPVSPTFSQRSGPTPDAARFIAAVFSGHAVRPPAMLMVDARFGQSGVGSDSPRTFGQVSPVTVRKQYLASQ